MMDGIERIKVLAAEVKDEAVLEVVNHLISREDMNEKYLNEEKSLKQMIEFIKSNAKKLAQNNMAMIKDATVFSWAIHYWDESNKDLGLEKSNKIIKEEQSKSEEILQVTKNKVNYTKMFEKERTKKESKKEWVPEGQLSLF